MAKNVLWQILIDRIADRVLERHLPKPKRKKRKAKKSKAVKPKGTPK